MADIIGGRSPAMVAASALVAPGGSRRHLRRRVVAFLSANDERDAREIHAGRVVCQEFGESPGSESR